MPSSLQETSRIEVERKFAISNDDLQLIENQLDELGFLYQGRVTLTDSFIVKSAESLEKGELFRLRDQTAGDTTSHLLTIKKWVQSGANRERKEQEEPISPFIRQQLQDLSETLSGKKLLSYAKERDEYKGRFLDQEVTIALDTVSTLGKHSGSYMEIEILVPSGGSGASQLTEKTEQAAKSIDKLLVALLGGPRPFIKESYYDMLREVSAG